MCWPAPPFSADRRAAVCPFQSAVVITQHVTAPPASSRAPPRVGCAGPVFATAMAKKPSGRFRSCGEFAEQLSRQSPGASYSRDIAVPETRPIHGITAPTVWTPAAPPIGKRRRRGVVIGALVGAALLIAGGVFAAVKLTREAQPDRDQPSPGPIQPTSAAAWARRYPGIGCVAAGDRRTASARCAARPDAWRRPRGLAAHLWWYRRWCWTRWADAGWRRRRFRSVPRRYQ